MDFSGQLLSWYKANSRDLPWKHTADPYKIWLSEIILQQTRVEQGIPYYMRFRERFPTVEALAAAHIDEVLRLWQGLGYYSRARNLHLTAQQVVEQYRGIFPTTNQGLLALKGIGPYTAAAIASFAWNEPIPALDGNGYRILSRVFGIEAPPDTQRGKKQFTEVAAELLPPKHAGAFNQALMDFGSMVCTPRPVCDRCPLQSGCYAFARRAIELFPAKRRRITVRARYFHYLYIRRGAFTFIRKRTGKDIWHSLYEFPLIETDRAMSAKKLFATPEWKALFAQHPEHINRISSALKHQLSHQTIHAVFYTIDITETPEWIANEYLQIRQDDLDEYSMPRLLTLFLENKPTLSKSCSDDT
ncbi:MAG: A/G-specific adenine glycosylase [Prevotellaceae bacterium]|jgi:A/G-specific adenine glycosylase|nr:A/G-specific adenine glycosylase [Prevotellaceae bacterium]